MKWLRVVLLLVLFLSPAPAAAEVNTPFAMAALTAPGVVVGLGNAFTLHNPRVGWIVSGYVVGGLTLVLGTAVVAFDHHSSSGLGWGLGHVALGAIDVGLASLALYKRRRWIDAYTLLPTLGRDPRGGVVVALSVGRATW